MIIERFRSVIASASFAIIASTVVFQLASPVAASETRISSFEEFSKSGVPQDILWKVLARNGKSKTYTQVFALDGGTVGIANFAVGGLASLYRLMDTERYFGRSEADMIANYSSGCRPGSHRGNDTGWGCYSRAWWRRGMQLFVRSPESHDVQNRAWLAQMQSTVELALRHGWTTPRSLAIATGVANSLGAGGFSALSARQGWQTERVLSAYAGRDKHRQRRRRSIDAAFPARPG